MDSKLAWSCLDALDELRYLPLKRVGGPEQIGLEGNEQIAVVALPIGPQAGEQSQRLNHQRQAITLLAAELQQGASPSQRRISGWFAIGPECNALRQQLTEPFAQHQLGHHVGRRAHVEHHWPTR